MQPLHVRVARRFGVADDAHRGEIGTRECAIVNDLLDRRARPRDDLGEARESARPVADRHGESAQSAIGDEADLDHAPERRRIDVAAGKHQHDLLPLERVEPPGEESGERRGAGAFDDALLELDQAQDRERDRRFVDGDDVVDDALDERERNVAELRDGKPVGERRGEAARASASRSRAPR